jgi:hypothetical protein
MQLLRQRMLAQAAALKARGHGPAPAAAPGQATPAAQPAAARPRGLGPGYYAQVPVLGPGSLDWPFVVSHHSLDPAPVRATAGYSSARQTYELYVPPDVNKGAPAGLILHVDAGQRSIGWTQWQQVCTRHNLIFAGPHNAGNIVPEAVRARVVLDVLDDVRRRFPVDPDRTYITGISGGAHFASQVAHALPELFGGVVPVCGAWNLRVEQPLRQRMRERVSVALLTGQYDFNGPEMAKEFYPVCQLQGIRSRLWVYPGVGHGYPPPAALEEVFGWVEAGLPQRREAGALYPASRLTIDVTPDDWAAAVLLEGLQRLQTPGMELAGLFQIIEVADRWQGLPVAGLAQKLLAEFDTHSPVPWKDYYKQERLLYRYVQAKMFDGTLNRAPPPGYPVPRINLLVIGITLWQEISELAPANSPVSKEAKSRLAALHREAGR